MSSFLLKITAVITMLIDHIGDAIGGQNSVYFNMIGRIAFPIFAYQTVQSYLHTKKLKRHLLKLAIFAIISQLPFSLFLSTYFSGFTLNVLFTFLLGLITLFLYDKCENKILGFFIIILSSTLSELLHLDYGAFGILLIFVFYYFETEYKSKNIKIGNITLSSKKLLMASIVIIMCFSKYFNNIIETPSLSIYYILFSIFTSLSLVFVLSYNKKEGPKAKYFFYVFYPLHLIILYLISVYIIK